MKKLGQLKKDILAIKNPDKALFLQGFFKTGKGEYGEGDVFFGITVPQSRSIAREYGGIDLSAVDELLCSKVHEERLIALLILVHKFNRGSDKDKKQIYDFYLKNTRHVNNWDLVDLSADKIVGVYLLDKDPAVLYFLAKSENIWERRIAMLSTYQFIKNNRFKEPLKIAKTLLNDENDLIHKAVGWMLREVGKKNMEKEKKFLNRYYKKMPRTMLRYAIERFPDKIRRAYLSG